MVSQSFEETSREDEVSVFAVQAGNQGLFECDQNTVDPVYQAKAELLNAAFQEIGMGRYQWHLFILGGFGWYADNAWGVVTTLIINPVVLEFSGLQGPYLILSQCIGLLFGSVFWSAGLDVWGRRSSFNLTLLITGVAAIAGGGSPNALVLGLFVGLYAFGVGGNLPVDSAVFLEFIPASHQYLLTTMSAWCALGQLVASLIAWPFIANYTCASSSDCPRSSNQGWRYLLWTLGAINMIMVILRFALFHLHESPRYLMSRGRDEEAVAVVHSVAKYNGKTSSLTVDMFRAVETDAMEDVSDEEEEEAAFDTSAKTALVRKMRMVNVHHVKALFSTRKMALSTTLLMALWALIGMAFTLYNGFVTVFLQTRGADFGDGSLYITYRNVSVVYTVQTALVMGIPACILAGWMVELRYLGRKGTLAISSALTSMVLYGSTTARTSNALLAWNCGWTFFSTIMYAVLYAMTPEVFPAKDRGTGTALVNAANRISGLMAPIIALYANLNTPVPIYVSGALFLVSAVVALLLPFEPRGRASI